MLVIGEVSLTTLLLVGSGLLIQSLVKLESVPVGLDADSVVTAKLALTRARLPNGAAINDFLSRLTDDLQSAPGIKSAGISSAIPLSPGAYTIMQAAAETDSFVTCEWRLVDAGYFRTLRIPLLRGRLFGPQDRPNSPRVFVISQQTARALYGEENPIGRRLRLENGSSGEVVGVVGDVRMRSLGEAPERVVYFPPSHFGFFPLFNIVIRADGGLGPAAAIIRDRLKAHDPNLAAYEIQGMRHWVDQSSSLMRIRTRLVTVLGATALLLGVIGIYGVMSYLVAQRTREFGIRVALGARPWALPLGVVAQGLRFASAGIALGLVAAVLAGDRIRSLLFEVDARDPVTFVGVAVAVALVAVAASYVPARRAATTDPLVVLRAE
jgi:predicted permease